MPVKVILLLGGKGTRLSPLTDQCPKSLLKLDGERHILDLQLSVFRALGIRDISLIVGYRADMYEQAALRYQENFNIRLVLNPFYETTNNLVAVWF